MVELLQVVIWFTIVSFGDSSWISPNFMSITLGIILLLGIFFFIVIIIPRGLKVYLLIIVICALIMKIYLLKNWNLSLRPKEISV